MIKEIKLTKEMKLNFDILKEYIVAAIRCGDGLLNGSWVIRKILEAEGYHGAHLEKKIKDELSK